jgi:(S)-2-hydroxyglutarate dehydrogenase
MSPTTTGNNSGVVHAGIYYTPGTLRAELCVKGVGMLRDFCAEEGVAYDEVGKVIVATEEGELPRLDRAARARPSQRRPRLAD